MYRSGAEAQGLGPVGRIQELSSRLAVCGMGGPRGDLVVTQALVGVAWKSSCSRGPLPSLEPFPPQLGPDTGSGEACAWADDSSFSLYPGAEEMLKETRGSPFAMPAPDRLLVG